MLADEGAPPLPLSALVPPVPMKVVMILLFFSTCFTRKPVKRQNIRQETKNHSRRDAKKPTTEVGDEHVSIQVSPHTRRLRKGGARWWTSDVIAGWVAAVIRPCKFADDI